MGNKADPNLSMNPKWIRSLNFSSTEFTIRNPDYISLAQIKDIRQIVVRKFSFFLKYKYWIETDQGNDIDQEFAVLPLRNLRVITGNQINDEEYLSICRKIEILITNLRKDQWRPTAESIPIETHGFGSPFAFA